MEKEEIPPAREKALLSTIEELSSRLHDAEELLDAIRRGEVDAFLVSTDEGEKVYTLESADRAYRQIIEQMREGSALLSGDGTILYCNASLAWILETPLEQLIGKTIEVFIAFEDREQLRMRLGKNRSDGEIRLQVKDGRTVPVQLSLNFLQMDGMKVFSAVVMDLSGQKKAEKELRRAHDELESRVVERTAELETARSAAEEERERYYDLFNTAPESYLVTDEKGAILEANYASEALFAVLREGLNGQDLVRFFAEESREELWDRMARASQGEGQQGFELELQPTGSRGRYVSANVSPVNGGDPAGQTLRWTLRDITEQRQAEDALKRYAVNLQQSNRDLEHFAYVASHDLQEPLRTMVSFSQLLKRRYGNQLGKDADEYIGFIVDAGTRMQAQIHDLLEYSRVSTRGQEMTRVESEAAFDEAVKNLQSKIRRSGAKITRDPLPPVLADVSQLRQVFQNLFSNAIKFSQVGTVPEIHVSVKSLGDQWQFSVQDNGIGIAPEFVDRIFVIFQRLHTRTEYPGTGIGLAICKKIIDRHGGEIWVESEPGVGSTFHFTIPALSEPDSTG
jgi:PAS domain S-box-containing protein